jgi:hypothetical protein
VPHKIVFSTLLAARFSTFGPTQTTMQIPTDPNSIQAGIDEASDGRTVLVTQGVYDENTVHHGTALIQASTTQETMRD